MKKINTTYLIALSALVFASCSESDRLSNSIALSKEKIAFAANVVNGWNGNSHTRVQNGIAEYHGPLKVTSNTKQQLYLHPIIQNGVYFYNQEGELVTRDGIAISKGGNKIISTTRGSLAQDVNSGFGISAIYNDSTDKAYFVNNKTTKVGDFWFTENNDKWPASTNGLSFYAYAPHSNDNSMLRLADGDEIAQSKQIQYEASSTDIVNQPDFVVANSKDNKLVSGKAQPFVNLTFSHALTAISFVAAKDILSGTVKSVSVKNVKGNGIYNLETGIWTSADTPKDFTLLLGTDGNGVTVNGTSDIALTSDTQNFMMIPQRFTSDVSKVMMELEEADGTLYHLEASLNDTEWQAGHTVTYRLSSSSLLPGLEITTVSYPQDWVDKYTVDGKSVFNSAYKNGDAIGIYAINARGEVTQANVKATYDGTKWSLPGGEKLRNNATISYFAYFPYVTDDDQKLASMPKVGAMVSQDALSSEHAFFKGLEDNWEMKDQSTLEKLNAADLQVCKAVLDKTASGLNLTMQHGVGLADITLGEGLNYKLENYEEYKWTASIVSDRFEDRKMYKPEGKKVIGIVRANQNTELKGITSDWKGSWKSALTFKPGYANIQTATAVRADDEEHFYKFELGAVYYSDGSISNQVEDLMPDKFPVGIVVYIPAATGVDKWSERGSVIGNSNIGGHGLVMALKNVGSTGADTRTNYGNKYAWGFLGINNKTGYQSLTLSDHLDAKTTNRGSGYYLSNILGDGSPAVSAAKSYKPSYGTNSSVSLTNNATTKTTGWFLPSAGQIYAAINATCGGLTNVTKSVYWGTHLTIGSSKNVTEKINEFLFKAAGASSLDVASANYTYFAHQDGYHWVWSSSECNHERAVNVYLDYEGGVGSVYFIHYYHRGLPFPVRPFLAFQPFCLANYVANILQNAHLMMIRALKAK